MEHREWGEIVDADVLVLGAALPDAAPLSRQGKEAPVFSSLRKESLRAPVALEAGTIISWPF